MDTIIQRKVPKKRFNAKQAGLLSVALLGASVWLGLGYSNASGLSVDSDSIVFGEVQSGALTINVRGPGVLLPGEVRWLVAEVEGFVERVNVKAGESVEPGQVIMELSNPLLTQELEQLTWDYEATKAEIESSLIQLDFRLLEQDLLRQEAQDTYQSAKMFFDAETALLAEDKSSVSFLNYKKTEREMKSNYRRWQSELKRTTQVEQSVAAEKLSLQAKLKKKHQNLQKVQEQVERLTVKAAMPAVIQEMPFEPGQRVTLGEPLSKLAKHGDLYAELRIPEIQIRKVALGQEVLLDTRNNKFTGQVTRIDPRVSDGSVVVDVKVIGDLPAEARPDLSIEGTISVANISETLSVSRPLFAQSERPGMVFKVSDDGKYATRTSVTFGKGASDRIEVLSGLTSGDRIVLSDTSAWDNNSTIKIN